MIPFSRITLFEYVFHDLWPLGVTKRQEVLDGLHFTVACYVFRAVFIFFLFWEESPQAIALLRQRQMREVWKFAR